MKKMKNLLAVLFIIGAFLVVAHFDTVPEDTTAQINECQKTALENKNSRL